MTIRELAKMAGVSKTTVSRALNNAPEISSETKALVMRLAQENGYQTNPVISAHMSGVRNKKVTTEGSVLAIVPLPFQERKWGNAHLINEMYRKGVEARSQQLGFKVEDFSLSDNGHSYKRLSDVLYQRGIEVVLVPSIGMVDYPSEYQLQMDWDRFFCAALTYEVIKSVTIDRAVVSHVDSASLAFRRARDLGYKRIALGTRSWEYERPQGRWLAAYLLFQKMNQDLCPIPYYEFDYDKQVRGSFRSWYEENRPDIILGDRFMLQLARDCEIDIPGDVSFAQLDLVRGYPQSEDMAGIDSRFEAVGSAAVDLVMSRVKSGERGLPKVPHLFKVPGRWLDGVSAPKVK